LFCFAGAIGAGDFCFAEGLNPEDSIKIELKKKLKENKKVFGEKLYTIPLIRKYYEGNYRNEEAQISFALI